MFKQCADSSDLWLCSSSVLTVLTCDCVQAVCWQLWHVTVFEKCADSSDTWLNSDSVLTVLTHHYVQAVCWQLWHMIMFKQCADSCDTWSCSNSVLTALTHDHVQAVCWQLWHTASCWSSLAKNVAVSSTWLIRQHPLHVTRAGVPWRHTRVLPTLRI